MKNRGDKIPNLGGIGSTCHDLQKYNNCVQFFIIMCYTYLNCQLYSITLLQLLYSQFTLLITVPYYQYLLCVLELTVVSNYSTKNIGHLILRTTHSQILMCGLQIKNSLTFLSIKCIHFS